MPETNQQSEYQAHAAKSFHPFRIIGDGEWALIDVNEQTVELFALAIFAKAASNGRKILHLQPPSTSRKAYRRIRIND